MIQDNAGAIQYNLAQQDMVALRVTARYAYAVGNPAARTGTTDAYPSSVLQDVTP